MKNDKFWLENPKYLFSDMKLIPMGYMSLEQQMNCVSRLIFFIFLILYLIGYQQALFFLILSIIFIIILYYLQKSKMSTYEYFETSKPSNKSNKSNPNRSTLYQNYKEYTAKSDQLYKEAVKEYKDKRYTIQKFPTYYTQQVEKPVLLTPDQNYVSKNQALVGQANPKTRIAPIQVAPIYDFSHWKDNDFTVPNMMNEKSVQDYYRSGYYVSEENRPKEQKCKQNARKSYPQTYQTQTYEEIDELEQNEENENIEYFNEDKPVSKDKKIKTKKQSSFGKINEKNIEYNLPYNYEASSSQMRESVASLNDDLFTSTVVPGVYYKNQVIEPISSNSGISFTQQFPTKVMTEDENGDRVYEAKDSQFYKLNKRPETERFVSNYDVYDPRSNGYGTSYRGYVDKMTGRSRFFYDDVDSIRKPNYVTRNNIDHLRNAPTYGSVPHDMESYDMNENIRSTVESSFRNDTLDHRTDMMEILMRKRNSELWQNRLAPKSGRQFSSMNMK